MSKKSHILVKFKTFWNNLNDMEQRDLWDFLTALRGPDNKDETLKKSTTAVIRSYLLRLGHRCEVSVNREGQFILRYPSSHFGRHAKRAMDLINESRIKRITRCQK